MRGTKEIKFLKMTKGLGEYFKQNKLLSIVIGCTIFFSIINIVLISNFISILGKV